MGEGGVTSQSMEKDSGASQWRRTSAESPMLTLLLCWLQKRGWCPRHLECDQLPKPTLWRGGESHCSKLCFSNTVPESVSSKTPCVLRPERRLLFLSRRLLFLSGGCWFCDSTSKVIAQNQKCQNSLSVLSVAHRAELCVRVERTECLPSIFSLQSHLPPLRSTDRNPE